MRVSDGEVFLKDIAYFSNIPIEALALLEKLPVARNFTAGKELRLTSYVLSEMFRESISSIQKKHQIRIMFSLPPEVLILGRASSFNKENVTEKIVARLQEDCLSCRFEIVNLRLPRISKKHEKKKWRVHFGPTPLKGTFSVPVIFEQSGRKAGQINRQRNSTFWVSGRVVKKQLVPVATRRLQSMQRVKKGDFKMVFREVTYAIDGVPAEKNLVGKKLRQGILVGHVIWNMSLEKKKAIRFGDITSVIIGADGWEVRSTAIAQENADMGDQIKLLNPKSRKFISGLVIGERLVRVK